RHDAERVARGALAELQRRRVGERAREQRLDPLDPVGTERDRVGLVRARAAHRTAGARRVADERRVVGPTLRAARQMRQVAGEPEQLQLERERERVERRPLRRVRALVEDVEEARERRERALVLLLLGEEAEHRLRPDQADAQAVVVVAGDLVRPAQLDARDRLQLARALVELQLDVRQRLEAAAEARLRLPHALGDGADPAAVGRVEVEDAVGLPEADRAQDDRLGRIGAGGHALLSLGAGTDSAGYAFQQLMTRIQMYTTRWCGYCVRAKAL